MVMVVMLRRDGLRFASALVEASGVIKKRVESSARGPTIGKRSGVGYKTIIK